MDASWTDEETYKLIDLWSEDAIQALLCHTLILYLLFSLQCERGLERFCWNVLNRTERNRRSQCERSISDNGPYPYNSEGVMYSTEFISA